MIEIGKPIPEELREIFRKHLTSTGDKKAISQKVNGVRKVSTINAMIKSGEDPLNEGTAFVACKMVEYTANKIENAGDELKRDFKKLKKYLP